jgi:hypothetical protein
MDQQEGSHQDAAPDSPASAESEALEVRAVGGNGYEGEALRYLARARKAATKKGNNLPEVEAHVGAATVLAMLELADAIRVSGASARADGS